MNLNKQGSTAPTMGSFIDVETKPFAVTSYSRQSTIYNIFMFDEIESVEDFHDGISILNIASEDDEVHIYVNCPGGNLDAIDTFLMELTKCQAKIIAIASGSVSSAATLVFMVADEIEVSPFCSFLFHSASFGSGGKAQDVLEQVVFMKERSEKMITYYYNGFFDQEELKEILIHKKEYYMTSDEFMHRLEKRNLYLQSIIESQSEE